mmetsp:Transcript_10254/g.43142  ORF Transcript_10254/g.43142 Transcript_10254/m.43142 type:complete len:209 (+) Transcript_10254:1887-2513(+)
MRRGRRARGEDGTERDDSRRRRTRRRPRRDARRRTLCFRHPRFFSSAGSDKTQLRQKNNILRARLRRFRFPQLEDTVTSSSSSSYSSSYDPSSSSSSYDPSSSSSSSSSSSAAAAAFFACLRLLRSCRVLTLLALFSLTGAMVMTILFPSMLGLPSMVPRSKPTSSTKRTNMSRPRSRNSFSRPRNWQITLTRSPPSKNFFAALRRTP